MFRLVNDILISSAHSFFSCLIIRTTNPSLHLLHRYPITYSPEKTNTHTLLSSLLDNTGFLIKAGLAQHQSCFLSLRFFLSISLLLPHLSLSFHFSPQFFPH